MPKEKNRVLFVCLGNICRSPTGEGVLKHLLETNGRQEEYFVDSAGTIDYHTGALSDARMRDTAAKRNISLNSNARQVNASDLTEFDLILAMDRENLSYLEQLAEKNSFATTNLGMFSDFLDSSWPIEVPDPFYGGAEGFQYVLDMIQAGCPKIIEMFDNRKSKITSGC